MDEVIELENQIRKALPSALKAMNAGELGTILHALVIDAEAIMLGLETQVEGTRLDRLRILAKALEAYR
jgi:hypothetical protein